MRIGRGRRQHKDNSEGRGGKMAVMRRQKRESGGVTRKRKGDGNEGAEEGTLWY